MSSGPGSTKLWNTKSFAPWGAVLGLVAGVVHNYVHAFWSEAPPHDLLMHVQSRMLLFVVTGAGVLAAVSALHNRFARKR